MFMGYLFVLEIMYLVKIIFAWVPQLGLYGSMVVGSGLTLPLRSKNIGPVDNINLKMFQPRSRFDLKSSILHS